MLNRRSYDCENFNTFDEIMLHHPRTIALNFLIEKFKYKSYLEIGVNDPFYNYDQIKIASKVGVDPVAHKNYIISQTSDDYFASLAVDETFDLIFIDGLHQADQVLRDIDNSLRHLNDGGTIVCHDMLPDNEEMQMVPRLVKNWTGDCWKAWAYLRMTRSDLRMFVVDIDYGLGIIRKGSQTRFEPFVDIYHLEYAFFSLHKNELMNVSPVDEKVYQLLDDW
jgi:SAM-dependent methyltransferase